MRRVRKRTSKRQKRSVGTKPFSAGISWFQSGEFLDALNLNETPTMRSTEMILEFSRDHIVAGQTNVLQQTLIKFEQRPA